MCPIHFLVGVCSYASLHGSARTVPGSDAASFLDRPVWSFDTDLFSSPPLLFYGCFSLFAIAAVAFELFYLQRRLAIRRNVYTPWQVLRETFVTDTTLDGKYSITTMDAVNSGLEATPGSDAVSIQSLLNTTQLELLYQPPLGSGDLPGMTELTQVSPVKHRRRTGIKADPNSKPPIAVTRDEEHTTRQLKEGAALRSETQSQEDLAFPTSGHRTSKVAPEPIKLPQVPMQQF